MVPERQILIRSGSSIRTFTISPAAQIASFSLALLASGWLATSSVALWQSERLRAYDSERVVEMTQAVDALMRELSQTVSQLQGLRDDLVERDERIRELALSNADLNENLAAANQRIATLNSDFAAKEKARRLGQEMAGLNAPTSSMAIEKLQERTARTVNDLERAIRTTGLDIDRLLKAADDVRPGLGGPYIRLAPGRGEEQSTSARLDQSLARFAGLQAVVQRLPIAEPLRGATLMSGYGRRSDPITNKPAMHTGIDLSAPAGTPVLATAPGRIVKAEFAGPYGRLIEIDHGLGVTTRYAHLKQMSVRAGDRVNTGEPIGTVGSSGRSTGIHLHYEVLYRDTPLDPLKFIGAGRSIVKDNAAAKLEQVDARR